MKKLLIILSILLLSACSTIAPQLERTGDINIDSDSNDKVDVAYGGTNSGTFIVSGTATPDENYDSDTYSVGDMYIETDELIIWRCIDNTDGAAIWQPNRPFAYNATASETLPTYVNFLGIVQNTGASGTEEYTIQNVSYETVFWVEATVAQIIELDFASGENPYLDGTQVGANNEIDISANIGARAQVRRMQIGGSWVWWVETHGAVGTVTDGGADD